LSVRTDLPHGYLGSEEGIRLLSDHLHGCLGSEEGIRSLPDNLHECLGSEAGIRLTYRKRQDVFGEAWG